MHSTVVYGTAGTGKTTWLINHLTADTQENLSVLFFTFSTSAADEIKQRLTDTGIKINRYYFSLSGTIHSLAFSVVINNYDEDLEKVPYKFLKEEAIPYSRHPFDTNKPGDFFLSMITYAINRAKTTEPEEIFQYVQEYKVRHGGGVDAYWVLALYKKYVKWKAERNKLDFNDLLVKYYESEGDSIVADRVYVDEAQDLSPLMHSIITEKIQADEYYFIGDPLQNIYESLIGSDPELFMRADNKILLDRGHRVPTKIFRFVLRETRPGREIYNLYIQVQHPAGGELLVTPMLSLSAIIKFVKEAKDRSETVAILLPKNRQVTRLANLLLRRGVIPRSYKSRSPISVATTVLEVFHELERGEISEESAKKLKKHFSRTSEIDELISVLTSPLFSTSYKKAYFSEFLVNNKIFSNGEISAVTEIYHNVIIDTIHAAKGREADVVIILDPRYQAEQYPSVYQRQLFSRLFFVGGTRAKRKLIIAKNIEGVKK